MTSLALNPDYDFRRRFSVPFEEQKRLQEAAEEAQKRPGFGQAFGAAVNTEWITSWLGRQLRAGIAGNEDDPNYSPFADDEWKSLTDGLDPTYWGELGYANSRIHALQIRDNMLSVQQSRDTLGRAGAKGIVATFGAAFLDPTIIAATIATGGIAGGARAGATLGSRALRGAGLGVAVDVPAEMYLASQDPERGVSDILLAGAATVALGSVGEIVGGKLVDRAVRRDTAAVRASSGLAMGAASPNDPALRALRPGETVAASPAVSDTEAIADSLRTHLANDGWSDSDISGLEADPEQWAEAMKLYGNPEPPPNIPSSPATLIGSWDPSRASDASSPLARADRTFAGFSSDSRTPADLRFLGSMLFTNPLARGGNGVSIMGADQFARRLRHSSIDGLSREMTPAFRKFQKANGFRHRFESTDGIGKFNEAVIMEVELGPTAGKGASGDAVREAAVAHRKFYDDWLDRLRDGGAIDADTHAILKGEAEAHGYFPRNPDGIAVREFEVKHGDAGSKALRELYAQSHASKIGELDKYRFGKGVVEALGWNFRSTLAGMVKDGAEKGIPVKETFQKMAGWVSDRLAKSEMFDEDEIAKIVAVATDPDALYEEFASGYARAQKFSRLYLATVRGIGTMTAADQLRLYTGKRLQFLREVLDDERFNNFNVELRDEDVAEIIARVEKRETQAEQGVPSNLRYRSALDNYYVYDATRDLGSTETVNMTVNDFSDRNLWAVADRYSRSLSADLALRKVKAAFAERVAVEGEEGVAVAPIKTVAALQAEVEKHLIANGLDPAVSRYGKALKARFEVGIREIASIAQPTSAAGEAMRQPLRIWRRFVNSVSNGTFGFAALPESSRILAYGGVVNTINSIPMLKQQLALARQGKMSNEFLDFGDFFANMMTTNEFNPLLSAIDPDDPRTFGRKTLMDKVERGTAYMERKSFQATGMFHMERAGRRLTAATAVNKYINDFARGRQWNAKKLDSLGLSPEDAKRVGAAINHELGRENGAVVRVKSESFGHKVTRFRIDQFEDQVAASLLTQSMSKWASRVFQESDVGSKFLIQTDPILRIFTHFMDFTLGGWTKHTLYGVQHFKDPEVYLAMAYGTLLGSAVYIAQSYAMFAQRQEELKKTGADINDFDFFRVFMAGVQRGGHFSILPQVVDFAGARLKLGTPFDARSSGLTYGGDFPGLEANPSSAYMAAFKRGMDGIGTWAFQGDDFSRDDIRAIYKTLPFQRHPVASNIFESMVRNVPEERR